MKKNIFRLYVEKKPNFNIEVEKLIYSIKEHLRINYLTGIRIINRYDIEGIDREAYKKVKNTIFSEPPVDNIYEENLPMNDENRVFVVEYLPGQYDQRADSAAQCVQIFTQDERPIIRTAKVVVIEGEITDDDFKRIKDYYINDLDSRETSMLKPESLEMNSEIPENVEIVEGFNEMNKNELEEFMKEKGLAMSFEDIKFCQDYFKSEKRNPTITEIKVIDTYWSDHCRHTTFETEIKDVCFEEGRFSEPIKSAYHEYLSSRDFVYEQNKKDICLMDIAVIGMKELRKKGKLDDLDVSEEINACSITVDVDINGETEKWLVMFKNETHNHPTEIEPFGGASTCLGGAIRDPLSGRSYVYQAMRVTGCADPRREIEDTLAGKLPQRKITTEAAKGYSSYGNQIGLATGHVEEIYHEGYTAKRMEVGAVIAAAPFENVVRKSPEADDRIILLGGRTGRDGCGGAAGSSKEHNEESLSTCGAEVQKGNAPTERKIQRLFRNDKVSKLIKKCNDFGAGGVSVAIGELADGLKINLDLVPKKYEGLDGTELAISESQERMAVVVNKEDVDTFVKYAEEENLEAVEVAEVTDDRRLKVFWRNNAIVDLSRDFLDTNGVKQNINVKVAAPKEEENFFNSCKDSSNQCRDLYIKKSWLDNLRDLNVCSQKGLVEMFDSSIGAGTVLMPFGGKYQMTPAEAMAAKIPVLKGETNTGTIMAHGYNPYISQWSPFHGAVYAVVESAAKVVAAGGDYSSIRLTFQEYFEKLGNDPVKWGKPLSALLGALHAQKQFEIPAIGGKDSMSGTFKELNVPPTLVSFAVNAVDVNNVISPEFKNAGSKVVLIKAERDENELPKFDMLKNNFETVTNLIKEGKVLSAHTVKGEGIAGAISKMSFGNKIGFKFNESFSLEEVFNPMYGSIILELCCDSTLQELRGVNFIELGTTQVEEEFVVGNEKISIEEAVEAWTGTLEETFPTQYKAEVDDKNIFRTTEIDYNDEQKLLKAKSLLIKEVKPKVLIPVFPGTNCEYDLTRAFEKAGGEVETIIFNNLSPEHIVDSIDTMADKIDRSQMIMLPGGFSAGDEPDGSGKFIATILRNPKIKEAVMNLLKNRDGLMLGICNGFQALIKLGLLPFGEIGEVEEGHPTLTHNKIGRHISCMVQTKVVSTKSPWFNNVKVGDIHTIPVSHGEGRFYASDEAALKLFKNGQVATQYVDMEGNPTYDIIHNPNGSICAVEGITSPDGRILGKMGHSERVGNNVIKNVIGNNDQKIFEAGIRYFK